MHALAPCFISNLMCSLFSELNAPFAKWDSEQVADWLRGMGLAQYSAACRVWVKNGGTLLGAAPLELEKVRNFLRILL